MQLRHTMQRRCHLLSALRRELAMSSTLIGRLKFQNALLVNGQCAHTDAMVEPGDVITVLLDEPTPAYPPEDLPLTILYEDDALLALDKPSGMLTHPSSNRICGTLANRVIAYYARTGQHAAFHPVTRLDRDTFGVVLVAKNSHVHALLHAALLRGEVEKTYHAAVFGCPPQAEGIWEAPIGRVPGASLLRRIDLNGQPAVTHYRVFARSGPCALLALRPQTGRTHQLRVHCLHFGFPILGDPQYATDASRALSVQLGLHGQQLCAVQLSLLHPLTQQPMQILSHQRPAGCAAPK